MKALTSKVRGLNRKHISLKTWSPRCYYDADTNLAQLIQVLLILNHLSTLTTNRHLHHADAPSRRHHDVKKSDTVYKCNPHDLFSVKILLLTLAFATLSPDNIALFRLSNRGSLTQKVNCELLSV